MNKGFFSEITKKYLNGKASKKEAELYESIYDSLQKPGKKWNELQLPDRNKVREEIYKNIISNLPQPKKSFIKRINTVLKVAASILILISLGLGGYFMFKEKQLKYEPQLITEVAQYGEKRIILLEDSTQIVLNAGSKISYYRPFQKNKREIILLGEAFFNVTKDKKRPFIVTTKDVTTTVLGTSFNIYAYNDEDINVTVSTGKVKVTYIPPNGSTAKTAILFPGEQAAFSIDKSKLSKHEVDIKHFIEWQNDIIYFKQESFSSIIKKLKRNYNVNITCDDMGLLEKTITSVYENAELAEILDDLKFILGFEYTYLSTGKILISN